MIFGATSFTTFPSMTFKRMVNTSLWVLSAEVQVVSILYIIGHFHTAEYFRQGSEWVRAKIG
jgi:hypothetical protein